MKLQESNIHPRIYPSIVNHLYRNEWMTWVVVVVVQASSELKRVEVDHNMTTDEKESAANKTISRLVLIIGTLITCK
jgi:hypothetical protein